MQRYADGMALQFQGLGGRFDNCVWEWNSWTALGSITPGAWIAAGETVILLQPPPLPLVGVLTGINRGCDQNDSLADG